MHGRGEELPGKLERGNRVIRRTAQIETAGTKPAVFFCESDFVTIETQQAASLRCCSTATWAAFFHCPSSEMGSGKRSESFQSAPARARTCGSGIPVIAGMHRCRARTTPQAHIGRAPI